MNSNSSFLLVFLCIGVICALSFASPIKPGLELVPLSTKSECEKTGECMTVGDMIIATPTKPKNGTFVTNSAVANRAWPDGIVPYVIDASVTGQKLRNVMAGINDLNSYTCVTLRRRLRSDRGYIKIKADEDGCFSWIGYTRQAQPVNIGPGCDRKGTVIHEIMHALGFFHEQSREDRDEFVKIHFENIEKGRESQFNKTSEIVTEDVSYYGVTYNYESLMHYDPQAFSDPVGAITIESLNNPDAIGNPANMGQRIGLTQTDVDEINTKYQSTSKCAGRK